MRQRARYRSSGLGKFADPTGAINWPRSGIPPGWVLIRLAGHLIFWRMVPDGRLRKVAAPTPACPQSSGNQPHTLLPLERETTTPQVGRQDLDPSLPPPPVSPYPIHNFTGPAISRPFSLMSGPFSPSGSPERLCCHLPCLESCMGGGGECCVH